MRRLFCIWFTLFAIHAVFVPVSESMIHQENETTESLVRQATLIFQGTVVRANSTTLPSAVPATESTAVVRVDEVIDAPPGSPNLARKEITVRLRKPGSVTPGEQALFFTKGWLMGNSIAVIEIGRHPASQITKQLSEDIRATQQRMRDEELQKEMASAEAIVKGRVSHVKPASIPHIGSEHDPDWYEAEIGIESVTKGQLPDQTVSLLFPHSDDVMWKSSPKFHEGEQGIWLLHRNQVDLPKVRGWYTSIKALDFHPPEEMPRIQRLMQAIP